MKKNVVRVIGGIALLLSMVVLFTQCESELNGFEDEEMQDLAVETRGPGDCPFNGAFNQNHPNNGNGPAISAEELCQRLADNFPLEEMGELSDAEEAALIFMREEEKLARDVYLGLKEIWNTQVFEFISKSEQRHMDAVGCLLTKYGLDDPTMGKNIGEFEDEGLQDLYDQLMTDGIVSLEAAFTVGANIEDLDIFDLTEALKEVDNDDITKVFENLTKGSRNHLRAFVRNLDRLGITYEPIKLTTDVYQEIINSAQERGGGIFCGSCTNGIPAGPGVNCDGNGPKVTGNQGKVKVKKNKATTNKNGRRNGKK